MISIHAPAEGATSDPSLDSVHIAYFNPRSRGGSDMGRASKALTLMDFNPRSRGGSDVFWPSLSVMFLLFQSTLPRRERRMVRKADRNSMAISIHAPAEGATVQFYHVWQGEIDFNPRSRGGSDITLTGVLSFSVKYFNPRSRGGSDGSSFAFFPCFSDFNPRSRGGSDTITTLI